MRCFEGIGRTDLQDGERFQDNERRVDNADELDEIIQSWIGDRPRDEVVERFDEFDVPVAPVYNIEDIMADEHYQAREAVITVADDDLGDARVQNVFPKFSGTPGAVEYLGPARGEHNDQVYGELLGYGPELLEELRADDII
jgi:formyl-CoA transferase